MASSWHLRFGQVLLLNYFMFPSTHWVITGTDFSGIIFLAWRMQPGCFTSGHFHFLFLCLLLFAITDCSGMFAFLLFNRRKFLLKPVKTFSWSDDCKGKFLQNLGESLWWALLGFYFPVQPYSVAWLKGKGPHPTAAFTSDSYSASAGPPLWWLWDYANTEASSWTGRWDKFN